jgi:RNA polymerase sigma-70 factor (ECF subfamily)
LTAAIRKGAGSFVQPTDERYFLEVLECESVLRACLFRYTRNVADVDELLQETYARLLAPRSSERSELQSVRAFALGIARNLALDWLRHQKVIQLDLVADIESLNVLAVPNQVEEIVNAHQELALLSAAINELPAKCREVFVQRKVYGRSQKEIAARLGISENTVEQHLVKAARKCAQALFDTPLTERRSNWVNRVRRRLSKP